MINEKIRSSNLIPAAACNFGQVNVDPSKADLIHPDHGF